MSLAAVMAEVPPKYCHFVSNSVHLSSSKPGLQPEARDESGSSLQDTVEVSEAEHYYQAGFGWQEFSLPPIRGNCEGLALLGASPNSQGQRPISLLSNGTRLEPTWALKPPHHLRKTGMSQKPWVEAEGQGS